MTYRRTISEGPMGRVNTYTCIQCGTEHTRREMAEAHAAYHAKRALHELVNDPEYNPIRKPEPPEPVRKRRRSEGALR